MSVAASSNIISSAKKIMFLVCFMFVLVSNRIAQELPAQFFLGQGEARPITTY